MSSLGLMSALKGMGNVTMPTVPEEDREQINKNSEDEDNEDNDDDDEDLERAQVSTRGLNKGIQRPDENFNNDDLELTTVTQVRLWDSIHGKMIDADSDADLQLNGSPSARSPDKLSLPGGSRPESKNEMRESVDSGQERVDALLEAEEDYD